jgi:hypothetical protein
VSGIIGPEGPALSLFFFLHQPPPASSVQSPAPSLSHIHILIPLVFFSGSQSSHSSLQRARLIMDALSFTPPSTPCNQCSPATGTTARGPDSMGGRPTSEAGPSPRHPITLSGPDYQARRTPTASSLQSPEQLHIDVYARMLPGLARKGSRPPSYSDLRCSFESKFSSKTPSRPSFCRCGQG